MNRSTSLRRSVARAFLQRTVVASLFAVGCATSRIPAPLRGYDIVVEGKDDQSVELARALREYGFRVRRNLRGGSGPSAALIYFTFPHAATGEPVWLHVRLADTRSGVIVRAGTILLDSLTATPRARASAAIQALVAAEGAPASP